MYIFNFFLRRLFQFILFQFFFLTVPNSFIFAEEGLNSEQEKEITIIQKGMQALQEIPLPSKYKENLQKIETSIQSALQKELSEKDQIFKNLELFYQEFTKEIQKRDLEELDKYFKELESAPTSSTLQSKILKNISNLYSAYTVYMEDYQKNIVRNAPTEEKKYYEKSRVLYLWIAFNRVVSLVHLQKHVSLFEKTKEVESAIVAFNNYIVKYSKIFSDLSRNHYNDEPQGDQESDLSALTQTFLKADDEYQKVEGIVIEAENKKLARDTQVRLEALLQVLPKNNILLQTVNGIQKDQGVFNQTSFEVFANNHLTSLYPFKFEVVDPGIYSDLIKLHLAAGVIDQNQGSYKYTQKIEALIQTPDLVQYDELRKNLTEELEPIVQSLLKKNPEFEARISPVEYMHRVMVSSLIQAEVAPDIKKSFQAERTTFQKILAYVFNKNEELLYSIDKNTEQNKELAQAIYFNHSFNQVLRFKKIQNLWSWSQDQFLDLLYNRNLAAIQELQDLNQRNFLYFTRNGILPPTLKNYKAVFIEDLKDEHKKAWVNEETVAVGASALLLATVPFTFGTTAPLALEGMAVARASIALANTVGSTVLATQAGIRISDRVQKSGVESALFNVNTYLDALMVVGLLPRPVKFVSTAPVGSSFLTRLKYSTVSGTASYQAQTAGLFIMGSAVYGTHLLVNAESISKNLLIRDGVVVDPWTIRRRGLMVLALAGTVGAYNRAYFTRGLATNGEGFKTAMKDGTVLGSIKTTGQGMARRMAVTFTPLAGPAWAMKDSFVKSKLHWLIKAPKAFLKGFVWQMYQILIFNEAILYAYSNSDFSYLKTIEEEQPYPILKEDESAVLLSGFDPLDLLYLGTKTTNANKRELELYGKKYFSYDYKTPDDFVTLLQEHAKKHGRIRFLKVATHGLPGKAYAQAPSSVFISPDNAQEQGWVDVPWMNKNAEEIKKIAHEIFAPDARVVFYSCLVGANINRSIEKSNAYVKVQEKLKEFNGALNERVTEAQNELGLFPELKRSTYQWFFELFEYYIDEEKTDEDIQTELAAGDDFLKTFAETFLVNGGRVDTSTRLIIGIDALHGSLFNEMGKAGILESEEKTKSSENMQKIIKRMEEKIPGYLSIDYQNLEEYPSLSMWKETPFAPLLPKSLEYDNPVLKKNETKSILFSYLKNENGLMELINPMAPGKEITNEQYLEYTSERVTHILFRIPKVWIEYGTKLEGGFWGPRFKSYTIQADPMLQ